MRLANPEDLQLECGGLGTTVTRPHGLPLFQDSDDSLTEEQKEKLYNLYLPTILDIEVITVHPSYDPVAGPANGHDIATIKIKNVGTLEEKMQDPTDSTF